MPVLSVVDGSYVRANHIYVIPPNATLTIEKSILQLEKPAPARQQRRPIDTFFKSLAKDQAERAIAIVLAGVGSDGTQGLAAVKECGGLTLAQADPGENALPGMPMSAAASGSVDHLVPVEDMPAILIEHLRERHDDCNWTQAQASPEAWSIHVARIAKVLKDAIGHDFSDYKRNTMIRRIQRRMQALRIESVEKYIEVIETDHHEVDLLFRDLLIGVTQFFRDPDAFAALSVSLISRLVENRKAEDAVRVWVAGCATGEEVYSLAILLAEAIDTNGSAVKVAIFGTDVDSNAIAVARAGRYHSPLSGISPDRLEKWFTPEGDLYKPVKAIRDMCIFSVHSVIKDPPFSQIDLISCRNVLIYLNSELQHRVMQTFHYSLKPAGHLFLGPSENVARDADLFDVVDKKHRILKRRIGVRANLPRLDGTRPTVYSAPAPGRAELSEDRIDRSIRRALERHSPAYFVVNSQYEIVRFSGSEAGRYLEPSPGAASLNLFALLRRSVRAPVRKALQTAMRERREVVHSDVATISAETPSPNAVTLIVEPIEDELFIVAFSTSDERSLDRDSPPPAYDHGPAGILLDQELRITKAQLEAATNELETFREDKSASTEELHSINEELQSSNEELETAKEEMQSINEELQTVNSELQAKNNALERLNDDLQNLFDSTHIATLFLDNNLNIRSFTPAITSIFHLRDTDRGRPINEIASVLDYTDFERDVGSVLRTLSVVEHEVSAKSNVGSIYLMRMRPFRRADDRIDGVVIVFIDISDLRRQEAARLETETAFRFAQDAAGLGAWQWDLTTNKMTISSRGLKILGIERFDRPLDYEVWRKLVHPADIAAVENNLNKCRGGGGDWQQEFRILHPDGIRWLLGRGHLLCDARAAPSQMHGIYFDITSRKIAEDQQKAMSRELDHRVKNILALISSVAQRTIREATTIEDFRDAFMGRIDSMARTHSLLSRAGWHGVNFADLVREELAPYANASNSVIEGPKLILRSEAVEVIAVVMHELVTNAVKYGALSVPQGRVAVRWERQSVGGPKALLAVEWRETGGPTVVPPSHLHYGSSVIRDLVPYQVPGGTVEVEFAAAGVSCRILLPLDRVEIAPE